MAQQRRGGFKRRKKVDYIAANKTSFEIRERVWVQWTSFS